MNRIYINGLTFDDMGNGDGKILNGNYYIQNSLAQDSLDVDNINIRVRYPLSGPPDDSIIEWEYGSECTYYQDEIFFGKFYFESIKRVARYEYEISFQSPIGILNNKKHYGGLYRTTKVPVILADIIGNSFVYEIDSVFNDVSISGYLPIDTAKNNLQQVLFASGISLKKNAQGDIYFTSISRNNTPKIIDDSKVYDTGDIEYKEKVSKVTVSSHSYKLNPEQEEIFSGDLTGTNFASPKGASIINGAMLTFSEPYTDFIVENSTLLESDTNYIIVGAGDDIIITAKKYNHTVQSKQRTIIASPIKENIASVEDATLITELNIDSVIERLVAYYSSRNVLSNAIVSEGEKPTDNIIVTNQFGDSSIGYIESIDGTMGPEITRSDMTVALNYNPPAPYDVRDLQSISLDSLPTKLNYGGGDYFNPAGMTVRAHFEDGSSRIVYNYTWSKTGPLKETDTSVDILYYYNDIVALTSVPITVTTQLSSITVYKQPDKMEYEIGDYFDTTGMIVRAYFSDNSYIVVDNSDLVITPSTPITADDGIIYISYTYEGVTKTTSVDIAIGNVPELNMILITQNPTKMTYEIGDYFDPTGMVVTAVFENETSKPVTGFTFSPQTRLGNLLHLSEREQVTISYTWSGVTKTTSFYVNMKYLTSLEIDTMPYYTEYYEGDMFNRFQMKLKAVYNNGDYKILNDEEYVLEDYDNLVMNQQNVKAYYTDREITKSVNIPITVSYFPYQYTSYKYYDGADNLQFTNRYAPVLQEICLSDYISSSDLTHRGIKVVQVEGLFGDDAMTSQGQNGSDGQSNTLTIPAGQTGTFRVNGAQGGNGGQCGLGKRGGKVQVVEHILQDDGDTLWNQGLSSLQYVGASGEYEVTYVYPSNESPVQVGDTGEFNNNCTHTASSQSGTRKKVIDNITNAANYGVQYDEGYLDEISGLTLGAHGLDGNPGQKGENGSNTEIESTTSTFCFEESVGDSILSHGENYVYSKTYNGRPRKEDDVGQRNYSFEFKTALNQRVGLNFNPSALPLNFALYLVLEGPCYLDGTPCKGWEYPSDPYRNIGIFSRCSYNERDTNSFCFYDANDNIYQATSSVNSIGSGLSKTAFLSGGQYPDITEQNYGLILTPEAYNAYFAGKTVYQYRKISGTMVLGPSLPHHHAITGMAKLEIKFSSDYIETEPSRYDYYTAYTNNTTTSQQRIYPSKLYWPAKTEVKVYLLDIEIEDLSNLYSIDVSYGKNGVNGANGQARPAQTTCLGEGPHGGYGGGGGGGAGFIEATIGGYNPPSMTFTKAGSSGNIGQASYKIGKQSTGEFYNSTYISGGSKVRIRYKYTTTSPTILYYS